MTNKKISIVNIIKYTLLVILTAIMFFPLFTVFMMGTYYSEDIFKGLPILPSDYLLENLKTVFKANYLSAYMNSLIVSLSSVVICCLSSALIGFAIAKYNFKMKGFLFGLILVIMMIPGQISTIGFIREMRSFGLMNTLVPLIAVYACHPFTAFFMTQFIRDSVPTEILESGRLDGCSEPGIFFKLIVPIIKPGLMTVATLVFLWSWNSYMLPLLVINKQEMFTIPLMISNLSTAYRSDYGAIMCALSIGVLPMIILFALCSKTFIKGIAAGAVKG